MPSSTHCKWIHSTVFCMKYRKSFRFQKFTQMLPLLNEYFLLWHWLFSLILVTRTVCIWTQLSPCQLYNVSVNREVPMLLPEPYFSLSDSWEMICPILVFPWTIISLSDSRDTSNVIRFFLEPVPQLRDSWDKHMVLYRKPKWYWYSTMQSLDPIVPGGIIFILHK